MSGSKSGGSNNTAAFQMHVSRWARFTFSVNASLVGGSDWSGGAELASFCVTKLARPDFVADLGHIISGYSAVTGHYELCGLADYFGDRGVETS